VEARYKRAHLSAIRGGSLRARDGPCGPIVLDLTKVT
jgi:hypothetical protein